MLLPMRFRVVSCPAPRRSTHCAWSSSGSHIRLSCNREHEIEKIVLVTAHALADDRLEHGHELAHCSLRHSPRGRGSHGIAQPGREVVGQRNAPGMQPIWHTEKARDHPDRQGVGEIADEVGLRNGLEIGAPVD